MTNEHTLYFLFSERQEEDQENTHHSLPGGDRVPSPASPRHNSTTTTVICGTSPPLLPIIKRPLQLVNRPATTFNPRTPHSFHGIGIPAPVKSSAGPHRSHRNNSRQSLHGSSDFEHFSSSSECEDASSSLDLEDRNSSEEELTVINSSSDQHKRKWSQVSAACPTRSCPGVCDGSCTGGTCSSDAEVRHFLFPESTKPVEFSAAPPRGVHKLRNHVTPRYFFTCVGSTASPHKRHRQMTYRDVGDATFTSIQRPCLDFEKMQIGLNCNAMWTIS